MSTMIKWIRQILGSTILFLDRTFVPQPVVRPLEYQNKVDEQTRGLSLYQFAGCPFCVKVRRAIQKMGLKIELRDAQNNSEFRTELIREGGELQVPCLRIVHADGHVQWMYESSEIIRYLRERFSE